MGQSEEKQVNIQEAKRMMYSCKHHKEKRNPSANTTLGRYECKILKELYCIKEGKCNWHKPNDGPIIE
jgi:hypothetical protein